MLPWNERRLLTKISSWYYQYGWSHKEIADKLNVSRSYVSKQLQKARDTGIIDFYIENSTELTESLEESLKNAFNLKYTKVVSTNDSNDEALKSDIMKASVKYLMNRFHSISSLGMGWGNTMLELVSEFPYHPFEELHIVPLTGGMGSSTRKIHSNDLVTQLSKKLMCSYSYLYSPFIVDDLEIKRQLLSIPEISRALSDGKRVDLAVVGIGTTDESSTVSQMGYLTAADIAAFKELNVAGDLNSCFFDTSGNEIMSSFNSRSIGINLEDLHNIPEVLGISYGVHKVPSIYPCLKYQLINSFITDDITAIKILEMDKS